LCSATSLRDAVSTARTEALARSKRDRDALARFDRQSIWQPIVEKSIERNVQRYAQHSHHSSKSFYGA
jgi:hypothetical protein